MADPHLIEAGILKLPEVLGMFADGVVCTVATAVEAADITAGDFDIRTGGAIPAHVPPAGFLGHLGRIYTYGSWSGDTFQFCNGPFGQLTSYDGMAVTDRIIVSPVSANMIEQMAAVVSKLAVYQTKDQAASLNVTIAPGPLIDGGEELAYAGGTLALTNGATNHVYIYNNAGTPTVASNTTSFAAAGVALVQLAVVTCSGGVCADIVDLRNAAVLRVTGSGVGTPAQFSRTNAAAVGVSGAVDGANAAYTLDHTPIANTLNVYRNGMLMLLGAGNDYTVSGAVITFASAPATDEIIAGHYTY